MATESSNHDFLDLGIIRELLELPQDVRNQLAEALATLDETRRQSVLDMIAIVESPQASRHEKVQARDAIDEAFSVHSLRGDVDWPSSQESAFAESLRTSMKKKGITQKDLANRIGCTQPAISQMLNRKCRPQRQTIFKLADALGISPRDLWPDLDVTDILDTVAAAQQDQNMAPEEAEAYRRAIRLYEKFGFAAVRSAAKKPMVLMVRRL